MFYCQNARTKSFIWPIQHLSSELRLDWVSRSITRVGELLMGVDTSETNKIVEPSYF